MPSGTGHFLPAYTAADAEVVLIDACYPMLQAARHQARLLGAEPGWLCSPIQDLTSRAGPFDLIVMPNAALNQLAAGAAAATIIDFLAGIARRAKRRGHSQRRLSFVARRTLPPHERSVHRRDAG
jgi:hypothetical protein